MADLWSLGKIVTADRKRLFFLLLCAAAGAALAGWGAARWKAHKEDLAAAESERTAEEADAEYRRLTEPAVGRGEVVSAAALLASPEKFSGKRVILSGILRHSFEDTSLDLEDSVQAFSVSVTFDWQKIDEPMGDLSNRKASDEPSGMRPVRIVAEGTFHFRAPDSQNTHPRYVLMGGPGYFVIDRLFEYEPLKEGPNQPLQHNAGSRPSSDNSPESETPTSLGPRG